MKSHSDIKHLTECMIEIDVALRRARKQLVDAEWTGDEDAEKALRREIERLEDQRALGQTHDVPW